MLKLSSQIKYVSWIEGTCICDDYYLGREQPKLKKLLHPKLHLGRLILSLIKITSQTFLIHDIFGQNGKAPSGGQIFTHHGQVGREIKACFTSSCMCGDVQFYKLQVNYANSAMQHLYGKTFPEFKYSSFVASTKVLCMLYMFFCECFCFPFARLHHVCVPCSFSLLF
jgi:hypothetical protein